MILPGMSIFGLGAWGRRGRLKGGKRGGGGKRERRKEKCSGKGVVSLVSPCAPYQGIRSFGRLGVNAILRVRKKKAFSERKGKSCDMRKKNKQN